VENSSQGTVRITTTFSPEAMEWLDAEASRRAISLASLLRIIDDETRGAYLVKPPSEEPLP
jgi:hypothetical protein